MIPQQRLSSVDLIAPFLYPFPRDDPFTDFEQGGIGIQDPSAGLNVQLWKLRYDDVTGEFLLSAPTFPESVQFVRFDVSYVSLSFDSNMNPFISFTESGVSKFWWFNTLSGQQEFENTLIASASSPYATLDDRRVLEDTSRDNLLFYVRSGNLYFRAQRDRYLIEYLLKTGITGEVLVAGMGTNLRMQIIVGSF
jgi:hypothetical protein